MRIHRRAEPGEKSRRPQHDRFVARVLERCKIGIPIQPRRGRRQCLAVDDRDLFRHEIAAVLQIQQVR